ncbi:MAG: hypothetical protein ACTSUE_05175 [Promethearchaeota archaeon]
MVAVRHVDTTNPAMITRLGHFPSILTRVACGGPPCPGAQCFYHGYSSFARIVLRAGVRAALKVRVKSF